MADLPAWARAGRAQWTNTGSARPDFAVEPRPGQESVWDYPRPPAYVRCTRHIEVEGPAGLVASTRRSVRVLETSQAPAFYVPPEAIDPAQLVVVPGRSRCEWKGEAEYLGLARGRGMGAAVGWRYPDPFEEFQAYAGWVSFYPDRLTCRVDGEVARPMPGGFYGGWITDEVTGPFKGEPGSQGW